MKLTLPKLTFRINIKIRRPDGRVRSDNYIEPHSFVRNWYYQYLQQACSLNCKVSYNLVMKSTAGADYTRETSTQGNPFAASRWHAPAGNDEYGILVGSGDTPYTFTDYKLAAKIDHGTGIAGHLSYNTMSQHPVISDVGDTRTVTIQRLFSNNSGGGITVKEIGWAVNGFLGVNYNCMLLLREVLTTPITVGNAEELEVNLEFSLQYPEIIS